jgi:hypothetical protein
LRRATVGSERRKIVSELVISTESPLERLFRQNRTEPDAVPKSPASKAPVVTTVFSLFRRRFLPFV